MFIRFVEQRSGFKSRLEIVVDITSIDLVVEDTSAKEEENTTAVTNYKRGVAFGPIPLSKSMADEGEVPQKPKGKKGKKGGGDMLSEAAMNNVYYACHNVQELLEARGYTHPDFAKKKKKGKG